MYSELNTSTSAPSNKITMVKERLPILTALPAGGLRVAA
jgi:hypothetical protein